MKLKRDVAVELMGLADGELEGEAEQRARTLAKAEPGARQLVADLRDPRMAAWLRMAMDEHATGAAADHVVDDVMARLATPSGGAGGVRVPARRLLDPWARVGVALALAAGVTMYVAARHARLGPIAGDPSPVGSALVAGSALGGGVELREIDALSEVSVFEIAGARGPGAEKAPPSSLVIWIEDEAEEEKGP
jgi:hypothetical protein